MAQMQFGIVAAPGPGLDGAGWLGLVRRVESQGWAAVLVPDTLWTTSPFPALAAAAAVTTSLRLRPWVLAAPLRTPAVVVRECSALQLLSAGRLELGISAGRPEAQAEAARLGAHWGSPGERVGQVVAAVAAVREAVSPAPTVVIAAGGPRLLTAAAGIADRVALALPPQATEPDLARAAQIVRDAGPEVRLTFQVSGVGGRLPTWLIRQGTDAGRLADAGAVGLLPADPGAIAETLLRLQADYGIDEAVVPAELARDMAPVIDRLG